ncbi:MAG: recombinase family protein [Balneolales bacterium]
MKPANQNLKAAGYVRVSSEDQKENTSLEDQRQMIKEYCKRHGYQLTKIYADEGISGRTTIKRHGIQQALADAERGLFDVLIVKNLKRFGRDLFEILQNHRAIEKAGVKLIAVQENIENKMIMQFQGILAEREVQDIRDRMIGGKIANARNGIPPLENLPFARTFDKEAFKKGESGWGVDKNKVDALEWVFQEYVKKDRSLQQIALDIEPRFGFPITYTYLTTVLKEKCGTDWEVTYTKDAKEMTFTFEMPRILSKHKVQSIKDRLAHNRTNNRTDVKKKYLLTGFIRCMHCGKSLSGQKQHRKYGYYVHPGRHSETCRKFTTVPLDEVEQNVFEMIFEDMGDVANFEKAIADSLPDVNYIEELKAHIKADTKHLNKVQQGLDNLIETVKAGAFEMDDIKTQADALRADKKRLQHKIDNNQNHLQSLPDIEEVKARAHTIRKDLLSKYQSMEHLKEMTFEDKKQLLHFLFEGKAPNGEPYGIYIDRKGTGKDTEIIYRLFGRLRALKHKKDSGSRTPLFSIPPDDSTYKTNNFTVMQK